MSTFKKFKLFLKVKIYFFKQWLFTFKRYYPNYKFFTFDVFFSSIYFFLNPYRITSKFLEKKYDKKVYEYGETPLTQIENLSKICQISKNTNFLELGAGRGKISFWLHFFVKCKILAVEQVPIFVKIGVFLKKLFRAKNLNFSCNDFFEIDMQNFDIIYLYGTTLKDTKINLLIEKFKKLKSSVKIITISYSLEEYDKSFKTLKSFDISFPWGKTKAYLNVKRSFKCYLKSL